MLPAAILVATLCSCGRRDVDLGGGWFLRETVSSVPEAGGYHRHLLRGSFFSKKTVATNIADYKRYGSDCIVFQPITVEIQFLAGCGSYGPRLIAVATREGDWLFGQEGLEQVLSTAKSDDGIRSTVAVLDEAAIQRFLAAATFEENGARRKVGSGEVVAGLDVAIRDKPLGSKELDIQDENGLTRLARACRDGDVATVSALLSRGANPNIGDRTGQTALIYAAEKPEVVKALVAAGADVNVESRSGNFPLKEAVSTLHCRGRIESCVIAVEALLAAGADPNHRNRFGDLAETYASTDELRSILHDARLKQEQATRANGASDSGGSRELERR